MPLYGLTLVVAIWRYPQYFDTPLRYFPILLMYTLVNELLGIFILRNPDINLFFNELYTGYTWVIYNIYNYVFFLYFFYVYWSYAALEKHKNWIKNGGILFVVVSLINPFFQSFAFESQLIAYVVGSLLLLLWILLFFRQHHENYGSWFNSRNLMCWLSFGLLIFYAGYLPIKIHRYYMYLNDLNGSPLIRRIHLLLIIALYLCFIIGFLRMRKKQSAQQQT